MIDGTVREAARPGYGIQRRFYNVMYKKHSIKFQSICAPNGLIISITGPWEATAHDWYMYGQSGIIPML
jgi:hypothetical protein